MSGSVVYLNNVPHQLKRIHRFTATVDDDESSSLMESSSLVHDSVPLCEEQSSLSFFSC